MLQATPRPDRLHTLQQTRQRPPIAWKTGTSYGFRDAWSIGVSAHYTVGVWVGRPDGTPMPGHYGAETAAPLMFDIFAQLPDIGVAPAQPANVAQTAICWPLGTAVGQHPEHCEQQRVAWVVNATVPPTLGSGRNPLSLWVDVHTGLRVTPLCAGADVQQRSVALWPAALEPWLPGRQRRSNRFRRWTPAVTKICPCCWRRRIEGLEDGARLAAVAPVRPVAGHQPQRQWRGGELQW
ncbi:MAG: hypothetical protein R3F38_14850 [Gammaproteobacteria bacterium]